MGRTSLSVEGSLISEIPFGLAVYLGVKSGDTDDMPAAMAKKKSPPCAYLRTKTAR